MVFKEAEMRAPEETNPVRFQTGNYSRWKEKQEIV